MDFILINGGKKTADSQTSAESSLIALDATDEQSRDCSPPENMIEPRRGHVIGMSGQNLVVCGGSHPSETNGTKQCEEYDKEQEKWIEVADTLEELKIYFHSVQLDDNRIWMGRKCDSCAPHVFFREF